MNRNQIYTNLNSKKVFSDLKTIHEELSLIYEPYRDLNNFLTSSETAIIRVIKYIDTDSTHINWFNLDVYLLNTENGIQIKMPNIQINDSVSIQSLFTISRNLAKIQSKPEILPSFGYIIKSKKKNLHVKLICSCNLIGVKESEQGKSLVEKGVESIVLEYMKYNHEHFDNGDLINEGDEFSSQKNKSYQNLKHKVENKSIISTQPSDTIPDTLFSNKMLVTKSISIYSNSLRIDCTNSMLMASITFKLDIFTLHLAVEIFDVFVNKLENYTRFISFGKIRVSAIAALKIADVLNERSYETYKSKNIQDYAMLSYIFMKIPIRNQHSDMKLNEFTITEEELLYQEREILSVLDFNIFIPTVGWLIDKYCTLLKIPKHSNIYTDILQLSNIQLLSNIAVNFKRSLKAQVILLFALARRERFFTDEIEIIETSKHNLRKYKYEICKDQQQINVEMCAIVLEQFYNYTYQSILFSDGLCEHTSCDDQPQILKVPNLTSSDLSIIVI